MTVRATWLLHSSVRQLGQKEQFMAVDDLLLERCNGQLRALKTVQGILPIRQLTICPGGNLLTVSPIEQTLDASMPQTLDEYVAARSLLGQKLYHDRQMIGTVGDLQFNWSDGQLMAIEISRGLLPDLWYGRYHLTASGSNPASAAIESAPTSEGVE